MADACENCGALIGRLETPHLWEGRVVCAVCRGRLQASAAEETLRTLTYAPSRPSRSPVVLLCVLSGIVIACATAAFLWFKTRSSSATVATSSAVTVAANAPARAEPLYQGMPLSGWIDRLADRDYKVRRDAATAILAIGPAAVTPARVKQLQSAFGVERDERTRVRLAYALWQCARDNAALNYLVGIFNTDGTTEHIATCVEAVQAISHIGPPARAAIPGLRELAATEDNNEVLATKYPEVTALVNASRVALANVDRATTQTSK